MVWTDLKSENMKVTSWLSLAQRHKNMFSKYFYIWTMLRKAVLLLFCICHIMWCWWCVCLITGSWCSSRSYFVHQPTSQDSRECGNTCLLWYFWSMCTQQFLQSHSWWSWTTCHLWWLFFFYFFFYIFATALWRQLTLNCSWMPPADITGALHISEMLCSLSLPRLFV